MRQYLIQIVKDGNYEQSNTLISNFNYNAYNSLMPSLFKNLEFFLDIHDVNLHMFNKISTTILVICIILCIIFSIIIFYIVNLINIGREKILASLYEIPNEFVMRLSERCLRYNDILKDPKLEEDETDLLNLLKSDDLEQEIKNSKYIY